MEWTVATPITPTLKLPINQIINCILIIVSINCESTIKIWMIILIVYIIIILIQCNITNIIIILYVVFDPLNISKLF
jgi:hypothetical protein